MKEIKRYIDATETTDYILPAISLGGYYAIHIGTDKGDGNVACLCGQHHKQTGDVWTSPSVEVEPYITCGSCLRSMKSALRKNTGKSYRIIMNKIGQKLEEAEFHIKQTSSSKSTNNGPYEVEPESRILEPFFPRKTYSGKIIPAIMQIIVSSNFYVPYKQIIHAAEISETGAISFCGLINRKKPDFGFWVKSLDYPDVPNITCPHCITILKALYTNTEPRRDKTSDQRKFMVGYLSDYLFIKRNALEEAFDDTPLKDIKGRITARKAIEQFDKEAKQFEKSCTFMAKSL